VARDELRASVASFPVEGKILTRSEPVDFGFEKARGSATVSAVMVGERLEFRGESTFRDLAYHVRASSRPFEETLRGVVSGIQTVTAEAQLVIEGGKTQFDLRSNLAQELEKGFKRQLDAKLSEARKKIEEVIQKQVGEKRALLTQKYEGLKSQVMVQLGERRAQVDAVERQGRERIQAVEARVEALKREAEGRARKAAEDQLKKFKRPF
jgi:hypothetical protein